MAKKSKQRSTPVGEREAEEGATPLVRLNKFLADNGVASRRRCDELIADGRVTIDGETVTALGTKVDPVRQRVEIGGVVLKPLGDVRHYYLLHKPAGVVCTNDVRETRRRAVDLIRAKSPGRIYTVGRLDEDTTGLILLTNDGDFAHRVMHPRYEVPKTYLVKVQGFIKDDDVQRIRDGIYLSEGRTAGARILVQRRSEKQSSLLVTLVEGKNREIRRVFARIGTKVLMLHRARIGNLTDRGLKAGAWRTLTSAELKELLAISRGELVPDSLGRTPRRGGTGGGARGGIRGGTRGAAGRRRGGAVHGGRGGRGAARPSGDRPAGLGGNSRRGSGRPRKGR